MATSQEEEYVYKEGDLSKRQRGLNHPSSKTLKFQERWCRLTSSSLEYYEKGWLTKSKGYRGNFPVDKIQIVQKIASERFMQKELLPGKDNCFQVGNSQETMYFAVQSDDERSDWMEAFRRVASDRGNNMLSHYHGGLYKRITNIRQQWSCCYLFERTSQGCFPVEDRLLSDSGPSSHSTLRKVPSARQAGARDIDNRPNTAPIARRSRRRRHSYSGRLNHADSGILSMASLHSANSSTERIHCHYGSGNQAEAYKDEEEISRGEIASKAIQKKSREIVKTISDKPQEIALALYEEDLISDSALEKAANHEIPTDSRAIALMLQIKEAVKEEPSCFHTVCDILGTDSLKVLPGCIFEVPDREATLESEDVPAPLIPVHRTGPRYSSLTSIVSDPGNGYYPPAKMPPSLETKRLSLEWPISAVPELLQDHFVILTQHLNVEQIRPYLHQYKVLTRNEYIQLLRVDSPNSKAVEYLVIMVESKGSQGFRMFVEALKKTIDQEPAHKDILEELKMDSRFSQIVGTAY